jgi:uncharacterized membrane protein YfcA
MPDDLSDKVTMFAVIGLVAWAIIGLPAIQYIPHPWFEHPSEWLVAIFTLLLVIVAYLQWRTTTPIPQIARGCDATALSRRARPLKRAWTPAVGGRPYGCDLPK